jgi:hypothetical protein
MINYSIRSFCSFENSLLCNLLEYFGRYLLEFFFFFFWGGGGLVELNLMGDKLNLFCKIKGRQSKILVDKEKRYYFKNNF